VSFRKKLCYLRAVSAKICVGEIKNATDEEIMEAINIAQAGEIVAQKKEGLDFLLNKEEKTFGRAASTFYHSTGHC